MTGVVGADLGERMRVRPGQQLRLSEHDPGETHGHTKADAKPVLKAGLHRLTGLQERLWAENRRSLLIVLQGMDTAGKDGTIGHVMSAFDPQGCMVTGFKVPTTDELAHDFLWRVHRAVPPHGSIGIFNRSHYEDVLVVRVKRLVPPATWRRRYGQIVDFERLLNASGTTVVKLFLHISRDEQRERLQARLDDPDKRWKFNPDDLAERKRWPAYQAAYEAAISRTSTAEAPWYVVPADHKWFRNLAVAEIVATTLEAIDPQVPAPAADLEGIRVE